MDTCEVDISEGVEVGILQKGMSTNGLSSRDHPCPRHPCLEDPHFLSAIATSLDEDVLPLHSALSSVGQGQSVMVVQMISTYCSFPCHWRGPLPNLLGVSSLYLMI